MRATRAGWIVLGTALWLAYALPPRIPGLTSEPEATSFMRFVEGKSGEGKLETAIVTYGGANGVEVDLITAVHVGDSGYYRGLQKEFEKYDSLLYEMVKPPDADPADRSDNVLSGLQRGLKNLLDLEFQLDAIDYSKKNFVHADMDPDTFFRLQKEKGENPLTLFLKIFKKQLEAESRGKAPRSMTPLDLILAFSSEDSARAMKLLMAREIEDMESVLAGIDEGEEAGGSVILSERNKVVVGVLRRVLKDGKKKVGIFYGGAHMRDLEQRLLKDLGLKKVKARWVTAWNIKKKVPRVEPEGEGETEEDVEGEEEPQGEGDEPKNEAPSPEKAPSEPEVRWS